MTEILKIPSFLSEANPGIDVRWGITKDETSGDSFKVILSLPSKSLANMKLYTSIYDLQAQAKEIWIAKSFVRI